MKRWISLILACLMLMMLLPAAVFAAGGPALDFELTAEGDTLLSLPAALAKTARPECYEELLRRNTLSTFSLTLSTARMASSLVMPPTCTLSI